MTEQELAILQKVVLVLIQVCIPPLLAWAIVEAKRYIDQLRKQEQWKHVFWAVTSAVGAAEQLGLSDQLEKYGESKLAVAIAFVEAQLAAAGVPLDVDEYADAIRAMIEAEVREKFPPAKEPGWVGEDGDGGLLAGGQSYGGNAMPKPGP